MWKYTKKEFVLGQGYVTQPTKILTQAEYEARVKKGIYANEFYEFIPKN